MGTDWPLVPRLPNVIGVTATISATNVAEVKVYVAKGMLLRRNPDREATRQIVRYGVVRIDDQPVRPAS